MTFEEVIANAKKCLVPFEVRDIIVQQQETIDQQTKEINKLTYQVNRLKKYDLERDIALHERLKVEAVKEFAEKAKQKICAMVCSPDEFYLSDYFKCIDNLVKETVGESS